MVFCHTSNCHELFKESIEGENDCYFWSDKQEDSSWRYCDENGKYYTTGCNRTGCIFCGFGCHLEKEPNRFQQLKETHPKLYEYCMKSWDEGGLGLDEVLNYINVKH